MSLDDRDYMRERRRKEAGARLGSASWIDSKARCEHDGLWFEAKNRGHNYRTSRFSKSPRFAPHPAQKWIFLLSALTILIPLYGQVQRRGWLPDFEAREPFPETGSVTVARSIGHRDVTSSLTIVASGANAVFQLYDPKTDGHILSVCVARQNRITVPAPAGAFRMRLIEGTNWHGPKRYFGSNTSYETVARLMTFEPRCGHIIDLNRRPDGNLKTRMMIAAPSRI
ncbi:hypothetical protein BRX37_19900 [Sphingomonas sp. S-NIH.Pt3_0716]|nr:hypothetical protein BRX37_19900 [Sphingomonas sp. S-NIH.Pt3_0716]